MSEDIKKTLLDLLNRVDATRPEGVEFGKDGKIAGYYKHDQVLYSTLEKIVLEMIR